MDMRLRRCTSGSKVVMEMRLRKCTSSSQIVLNDEDLLALILLRVPYTELMSFKSVSRKWLSLIATPHFTCLLRNSIPHLRASGLFIQLTLNPGFPDKVYFVPLDDPKTPSPFRTLTFAHDPYDPKRICILQSCNGLLLCSSAVYCPCEQLNCYVYNPSTNQLATIPQLFRGRDLSVIHIGLTFDPSKSVHYKVFAFVTSDQAVDAVDVGGIYIYSSETGTWKASVQCFITSARSKFSKGVYWNGCIHWLGDLTSKSEPGSPVSNFFYFNEDKERFETFPRPPIGVKSTSRKSLYFGESEGHLHVIEVCRYATLLSVYEMKSDYSGWFVKYQIDLDPISKVFPEMTNDKAIYIKKKSYSVVVLSVVRRESFREDSFLVLEIPGKVIRYNLVDRSCKVLWNFVVDFGLDKHNRLPFRRFQVWQYIESLEL